LRLVFSAWKLQLRLLSRSSFFMSMALLTPVAYGAIALLMSGQGHVSVRVAIGAGLLGAWSATLYGAAEALFMQRFTGTLEFIVGAPKPLALSVAGFSAASASLGLYSVIAALAVSVVFFSDRLVLVDVWGTVLSLVLSLIGLMAVGMTLAALYVVTRQAIELTNVLEYPVWILCGVLVPASTLWPPLAWLGKTLPLGWSMDGLDAASEGRSPVLPLVVAAVLTMAYFALSVLLLRLVENLSRVKGTLTLR